MRKFLVFALVVQFNLHMVHAQLPSKPSPHLDQSNFAQISSQVLKKFRALHKVSQALQELKLSLSEEDYKFVAAKVQRVDLNSKMPQVRLEQGVYLIESSNGASLTPFKFVDLNNSVFEVNHKSLKLRGKSIPEIWTAIENALPSYNARFHNYFISEAHAIGPVAVAASVLAALGIMMIFRSGGETWQDTVVGEVGVACDKIKSSKTPKDDAKVVLGFSDVIEGYWTGGGMRGSNCKAAAKKGTDLSEWCNKLQSTRKCVRDVETRYGKLVTPVKTPDSNKASAR